MTEKKNEMTEKEKKENKRKEMNERKWLSLSETNATTEFSEDAFYTQTCVLVIIGVLAGAREFVHLCEDSPQEFLLTSKKTGSRVFL